MSNITIRFTTDAKRHLTEITVLSSDFPDELNGTFLLAILTAAKQSVERQLIADNKEADEAIRELLDQNLNYYPDF